MTGELEMLAVLLDGKDGVGRDVFGRYDWRIRDRGATDAETSSRTSEYQEGFQFKKGI